MTPTLEYLTTCRLCGKEIAKAPPLDVPSEGTPSYAAFQYLQLLERHLKRRHPEQARNLDGAAIDFGAMLLTSCYQIADASVTRRADLVRDVFINQFARQVTIEELDKLVRQTLDLGIEDHDKALKLVSELRDLFTCRGQYHPQKQAPAEAPLILVP